MYFWFHNRFWRIHYEQKTVDPEPQKDNQSPLTELAERFIDFCRRFTTSFRSHTHSREEPLLHYLKGLLQGDNGKRNMERMAERVPDADEQSLQHFITDADWNEREVLDLVALEANKTLGGRADSSLIVDESGFTKTCAEPVEVKASNPWALPANGTAIWGRWITVRLRYIWPWRAATEPR